MNRQSIRDLESIGGRKQFGRVPNANVRKQASLPTNIVFWNEDTGMTYSFNTNGIVKFLRDSNIPLAQENIDWCADAILNTPITDSVNLNGNIIGISCEMEYDPRNRSLSQLGIAKSMVVRPMNAPPTSSYQQVQQGNYIPPTYGGQGGLLMGVIPMGDGQGIDFGKPTMSVYNDRLAKYRKDRSQIL